MLLQLGSFFTKYAQLDEDGDSSEKFIGINGILQLADDLAVDAESDVALLVLFWKLGVTECAHYTVTTLWCTFWTELSSVDRQGSITERDFMKLGAMQCHNLEQLRAKLPWLRARVRPSQDLSAVYKFAWTFTEPQAKSMELEDAIGLWRMLLADQFKTFDLEAFCKFLTQEHKKKIPRAQF